MSLELLPNELLIECLKYLSTFEMLHIFYPLNIRFQSLIYSFQLNMSFHDIDQLKFDSLCLLLSSNTELQQRIHSLQLSNENFCQIHLFLSKFSFTDFSNLQSLTLIQIAEHNLSDLSLELPCILSQLSSFHLVDSNYNMDINNILLTIESSRLRVLTIPKLFIRNQPVCNITYLQYLTIFDCSSSQLHFILNYSYQLKYLKVKHILQDYQFNGEPMQTTTNLKYLVIDKYTDDLFNLEPIFRRIPNLECLNISARDVLVIEASQWQNWIVNFLSNLKIFRFQLHFRDQQLMNNIEYLFNEFQNDFWLKERQWYTEYLLADSYGLIYSIPYFLNSFRIQDSKSRFSSKLMKNSDKYSNIHQLEIIADLWMDENDYYFSNIDLLEFSYEYPISVQSLKDYINLNHVKQLKLNADDKINSSFLLNLLKHAPNISTLSIHIHLVMSLLNNDELCFYLNTMIKKLHLIQSSVAAISNLSTISKLWQTFSNVEYLNYTYKLQDSLISILQFLPKISRIDAHTDNILECFCEQQFNLSIIIDNKEEQFGWNPVFIWIIR